MTPPGPEDRTLWASQAKIIKPQGRRDEALAHIERGQQVIVRIHNYKVHDHLADKIDFSRVHIIHNGMV